MAGGAGFPDRQRAQSQSSRWERARSRSSRREMAAQLWWNHELAAPTEARQPEHEMAARFTLRPQSPHGNDGPGFGSTSPESEIRRAATPNQAVTRRDENPTR